MTRVLVSAGLVIAAGLGLWATYAAGGALMLPHAPQPGTFGHAVLLFVMWWAMMLAMMLPSAAPAILSFAAITRKQSGQSVWLLPVFTAGYVLIWTLFSVAATGVQILTTEVAPLTGMMALTSTALGGALLIAAGLYQFTPLKNACLRNCQPPFMYLARHWRRGYAGALRMGLSHGLYCLGCCWVLMLLLFYGGVMELTWIVGLALYVAIEKFLPARFRVNDITGIALLLWGGWVLSRTLMT